jgi:hypothetical protein
MQRSVTALPAVARANNQGFAQSERGNIAALAFTNITVKPFDTLGNYWFFEVFRLNRAFLPSVGRGPAARYDVK